MVMLGVYMLYAIGWGVLLVVFKQDILLLQVRVQVVCVRACVSMV